MSDNIVTIKLQGKAYPLHCPVTQTTELQQAAQYLDKKLDEIRKTSAIQDSERVALLAAINIAHELLIQQQQQQTFAQTTAQHIHHLQDKMQVLLK